MNDDGYTLAEMLTAVAIIGLAFGGLVESGQVVGRFQRGALASDHDVAGRNRVSRVLSDTLSNAGPFLSNGAGAFDGSATEFGFDCAEGSRCGARVEAAQKGARLVSFQDAHVLASAPVATGTSFIYGDESGASAFWPLTSPKVLALRSVGLVTAAGPDHPLAIARLAADEPPGCVFDTVSQSCRAAP